MINGGEIIPIQLDKNGYAVGTVQEIREAEKPGVFSIMILAKCTISWHYLHANCLLKIDLTNNCKEIVGLLKQLKVYDKDLKVIAKNIGGLVGTKLTFQLEKGGEITPWPKLVNSTIKVLD